MMTSRCALLSFILAMFISVGATGQAAPPTATGDSPQPAKVLSENDNNFRISAGEVKTAYLQGTAEGYKLVRVEDGEQKGKDIVIFRYVDSGGTQTLTVTSHLEEKFITYDCYQISGKKARQTSIMGAFKDVPTSEMWSDGIKTLLIENIRIAK